jgi:hypothetical protein
MGRGNDLERSDGSDGDGSEHSVPEIIPGDTGGSDVASGEISAGEKEPTSLYPKPKTKRVASEKMKAALLRARMAKAEKRWSRTKQPTPIWPTNRDSRPQHKFFYDIV